MAIDREQVYRDFGRRLGERMFSQGLSADTVITLALFQLMESIYKSADKGANRGDFAKGREQMGMYGVALLINSDWKTIERDMFGENDGSRQEGP